MSRPFSNSIIRFLIIAFAMLGAWVCGVLLAAHDGGWRQSAAPSLLASGATPALTGPRYVAMWWTAVGEP